MVAQGIEPDQYVLQVMMKYYGQYQQIGQMEKYYNQINQNHRYL